MAFRTAQLIAVRFFHYGYLLDFLWKYVIIAKKRGGEAVKIHIMSLLLLAVLLAGCGADPVPIEQPYTLPPSLYAPEDFQMEGDYLTCTAGNAVMGIDVSSHQGSIDWQTVAESGVKFAFVRLGYRGYDSGILQNDICVDLNLNGARQAGIAVGAYFFSQAVTVEEAEEEAQFALKILGDFSLDLPLVYDWEYVSDTARTANVDKATLTAATLAFCHAVEKAGHQPMVYFNSAQVKMLDMEQMEAYPWWLAKYDMAQEFPCRADLWQYTNQGEVPGINGKVDIDLMFTDYGLIKIKGIP